MQDDQEPLLEQLAIVSMALQLLVRSATLGDRQHRIAVLGLAAAQRLLTLLNAQSTALGESGGDAVS
jgi:hypothetical protein